MKRSISIISGILLMAALLFNCPATKTQDDPIKKNSAKVITAFGFASPAATASIDETNHKISITVPYGTNLTLTPTITISGSSVSPESGIAEDFTSNQTYTVTAEDGSTQDYTVTVNVGLNPAKEINSFAFKKALNPALSSDVIGTISGNSITLSIPNPTSNVTVTGLIASFSTSGISVKIDSVIQESESTVNDFSSSRNYIVTAADGSTKTYTVTVTVSSDTTPPANVTGLSATTGEMQAILNWTAPSDSDFASVEITSIPVTSTYTVAKGTNSKVITGLTGGTKYTFTVKSADSSGNKSVGVAASAVPTDTTPPANVTGLSATSTENGRTTLSWTAPTDPDFASVEITSVPATSTYTVAKGTNSKVITGLTNEKNYIFTVKSIDVSGNKSSGADVNATPQGYTIGSTGPAGGLIFYVNPNFSTDGWRYLEATQGDIGNAVWGGVPPFCSPTIVTGATATAIGSGKSNTETILAALASQYYSYAAKVCGDYAITNGGVTYDDWFLPSKEELRLIFFNLKKQGLGSCSMNDHWSSTENGAYAAEYWTFYGDGSYHGISSKNSYGDICACRRF
jgi:hypothetical protein